VDPATYNTAEPKAPGFTAALMIEDDEKDAKKDDDKTENPDKSRAAWASTRDLSRKIAAEQHHFEM